ncbi:MAG: hypothetical protein KAR84_04510 [Elusimicrobiales bacterium]|nr:hypothetical protein [Elusimicrobiales bacterium]MCK5584174.1 hypothetical protein [Elusimicrobiales bacterium]
MRIMIAFFLIVGGNVFAQGSNIEKSKYDLNLPAISIDTMLQADIEIPNPIAVKETITQSKTRTSAYYSDYYKGMTLVINDKKLRVEDKLPKGFECGDKKGINIICEKGIIQKIIVKSRDAYLSRTDVAVGYNLEDIIRYYGKSEEVIVKGNNIVARYRSMGLDFDINRDTEKITKITIYIPEEITLPSISIK